MAAYRLAHDLGHVNVDAMLEQISTTQMREWVAFLMLQSQQDAHPPAPATSAARVQKPDKGTLTNWRDMKGLLGTRVKTPQA